MTAITAPLKPVSLKPVSLKPVSRKPVARAAVAPGRRTRPLPASVYWQRRAMVAVAALLAIAGAVFVGNAALQALGGGPLAAAEAQPPGTTTHVVELDTEPVARATYIVRSGDTLWTIARRLQATGDVRPLVDALAEARNGRPLQPGERIVLPTNR